MRASYSRSVVVLNLQLYCVRAVQMSLLNISSNIVIIIIISSNNIIICLMRD